MLDIQRIEKNYRVFSSTVEQEAIRSRIARADSIIEIARLIAPESEREIIDELERKLSGYRSSFSMLVSYLKENPPDVRVQRVRSKLIQQFYEFETVFRRIQSELEVAAPAQRDSILAAANKYIDLFTLDQIVASDETSRQPAQTSYIQHSLDTTRAEFLQTAQRFAAVNWEMMQADEEEAIRIDARAKRNIIFVLLLTAIISFFMIVKLPGFIVRPITSLSTMLRKTANGELDIHAPVTSHDEIGDLAASYNQAMERIRTYDELKTKKIASQRRSIDRLIDYLNTPVCILSKNLTALYYNNVFAGLFGPVIPQRPPDNGIDITTIPELHDFAEQIRKRTAQAGGDFRFSATVRDGSGALFKGRPVRNVALNLETIIVIGDTSRNGKEGESV